MKRLGLYCLVFFALFIASCSGADDASDDSSSDEARPAADEGDEGDGDTAVDGDEPASLAFAEDLLVDPVRIAMVKPESFVPAAIPLGQQEAVIVADLLYDGLTEVDGGGVDGDGPRLVPGLALDWSADESLTEWTFVLDASRIDAETVAAHFAVLQAEASGSRAASLANLEEVQAIGSGEVRFTLVEPDAGFAWMLSGVSFSVVGEGGAPSGRHSIAEDGADGMTLRSNDDDVPDVVLGWEETAGDAYDRLALGVVDAAVAPAESLGDAAQRFGTEASTRSVSRFYGLNIASPRLDDDRFAQAALLAVDRDRIVTEVMAVPAVSVDGLLADTLAGYENSGCGLICRHDPRTAADLVAEAVAGGSDVPELRIAVRQGDAAPASAIARDLIAAGFEAIVDEYPADDLAGVITRGDAELFAFGWVAVAGSIDSVVPSLFASDSPTNVLRIEAEGVDSLIAEAAETADDAARWSLLNDAHELAMAEGQVLPMAVAQSYFVAAPQVDAIVVRADGSLDIAVKE